MLYSREHARKLYGEVFDENGNVRACGRDACIELIQVMKHRFPHINFGDETTGMMEIDAIKAHVNQLSFMEV